MELEKADEPLDHDACLTPVKESGQEGRWDRKSLSCQYRSKKDPARPARSS